MGDEYSVPKLSDFINKTLNPIHSVDSDLMTRYLQFCAVVYYFQYAVGSVVGSEVSRARDDSDAVIVSAAISAYLFMKSCLDVLNLALQRSGISEIREVRGKHKKWEEHIGDIRDRVAAHPGEDEKKGKNKQRYIMSKRSGFIQHDDGSVDVFFRQISMDKPTESRRICLTPRVDLEILRKYLNELATILDRHFICLYKKFLHARRNEA